MFLGRHTCLSHIFAHGVEREIPILAAGAPPWVLVSGDRRRVARILSRLDQALDLSAWARRRLGEIAAGRVDVVIGTYRDLPVLGVESQMGGSATEIILREVLDPSFHPHGARAVIRVGTCGTVHDSSEAMPPLAIAEFASGFSSAIEQARRGVLAPPEEGNAASGARPEPPRVPSTPRVVAALAAAVEDIAPGTRALTGGCFSKDSLYAEQDHRFAEILRALGCVATEMELSTIGPIGDEMGIPWGGIMATAGRVPDGPWLEPEVIRAHEELAIEVALAALKRLAEDEA